MSSALPFTEVAGEKLTSEQTAYLEGLFAGLKNRGLTFTDVAPNPAAATVKPDFSSLIAEERIKRELHPIDAYPLLLEHAAANKPPDKENIFRFKWHGLFYLTPNKEAFMCRLRIPGGVVKSFQLRELARISQELTTGCVQITTRANFQLRLIEPKDAPEVLRRIQGIGLHTRGAGADNIRNITCNPTAGIDPHELIDTLPLCHQLAQIIINDRSFYDLPRKFNVAFDGGGRIGVVEDTNDIGLRAVAQPSLAASSGGISAAKSTAPGSSEPRARTPAEPAGVQSGVYFRVALGGATGHETFACDLGVLVKPEELLKVIVAIIRVYLAHGNRSDRKKARLKHLLETWTLEQYLAETERLLGYRLLRAPVEVAAEVSRRTRPSIEVQSGPPPCLGGYRHSHVGVYPQKQKGLNYVGVAVPVGQITPKQMLRLADLADNYGSGEVRLTVWQNLVMPHLPDAFVETVKKALVKMGLHWQQSNLRSGLVACTGNSYCKFASSNTKGHALELADYLEKRIELDQPINIHLTGCPNSCAQHYVGDVGLLGAKVKVAGETVEGYHVFVGGGFGGNQAVGRQVFQGISFEQLKPTLERILKGYLRHRQPGESFQKFTQRHDLNTLQAIFSNDE
ncbi:MAG: NirA family protein [Verrucomicrobia bacterium]|nr:MAG: NirA family protein [Verrucomicrobiota bacterium]